MRGLHEDFQASGWVDISRSIAKFNTLLLILTFTKYLIKIFDLLNVPLCSNYQRNRGNIFSAPVSASCETYDNEGNYAQFSNF